jgi:hypothetical protein
MLQLEKNKKSNNVGNPFLSGDESSYNFDLSFLERIETNSLIDMKKLKSVVNLYKTFQ